MRLALGAASSRQRLRGGRELPGVPVMGVLAFAPSEVF
jgi:hypothetical protein